MSDAKDARTPETAVASGRQSKPGTELMQLMYQELRELAGSYLRHERPGHTLQATALVHEAYLRMTELTGIQWQSPAHFFAFAAETIRRVLVDHARARARAKRGGGRPRLTLGESTPDAAKTPPVDVLDMDDALAQLAKRDARAARVVELRFFGGLTVPEVAEILGKSERTVRSDWETAKAWLAQRLRGGYLP